MTLTLTLALILKLSLTLTRMKFQQRPFRTLLSVFHISATGTELFCESYIRWLQLPTRNSATPQSFALATGKGTHLVQTMYTCVQGNTRPCTRLSGRDVHSSVHCSLPFCSPFRRSWWFGHTYNKATTRQPGILCGWSGRLEQCTTWHSFGTYFTNVQSNAQDTSVFSILLQWLTVLQSTSTKHCAVPL